MSGGHFDYKQYNIKCIYEEIEEIVNDRGKLDHWELSKESAEEFKKGIDILKKAYIYAQRIDWFLSGDDGETSFLKRLKEELTNTNT